MNIIKQKKLADWLDKSAQTRELVAPKDIHGLVLYRPITSSEEIAWAFTLPELSAKEVVFPPTDRLFTIEKNGRTIELQDNYYKGEKILFGVRPCDARGILLMDKAFINNDPVDQHYAHHREQTIIIGVSCPEIGERCFCTSMGGGPEDPNGMDIMLKPGSSGFEIHTISEKGLKVVEDEWKISNPNIENHNLSSNQKGSQTAEVREVDWRKQFSDAYWEKLSERCLSCRICAYVCPTCRCFDIRDETIQFETDITHYERIRCWDSCAGVAYRKIAGGHNPRSKKAERLRNRFLCKFYYFPEMYGEVACTGCGRCIGSCPVNIDITEVLTHFCGENAW
jgi:ferredoxin